MSASHPQELQIIQAFSMVTVPERILRDSNVKELIRSMIDEQDKVQKNAHNLDQARQEKKEGNFIGNWWNDRDDKVQEAQLDLSTSIGHLTQKSSQLLVVNTAISKVLSDQQNILLAQQDLLKQQTTKLEEQNKKILDQQLRLEKQQKDINAANEGLLSAKGVTQEQAQKLVGCVVRVTQAEQKIDEANAEMRAAVASRLDATSAQCADSVANLEGKVANQLDVHFNALDAQLNVATTQVANNLADGLARVNVRLDAVVAGIKHDLADALARSSQAHDAHSHTVNELLSVQALHMREELAQAWERHASFGAALSSEFREYVDTQEKRNIANEEDAARWHTATSVQLDRAQKISALAAEQQAAALRLALEQADAKLASSGQIQHDALKAHGQAVDAKVAYFDTAIAANRTTLDTLATQLTQLQAKGQQAARLYRLATGGVAGLALLSLGWQFASRFS